MVVSMDRASRARSSALSLVAWPMLLALLALCLSLQPAAVSAFSSGVRYSSVARCATVVPSFVTNAHSGGVYQSTPAPFTLTVGNSTYQSGGASVPIRLSAPVDDSFVGFIVSAFAVDPLTDEPVVQRIGSFVADAALGTGPSELFEICASPSGSAAIQNNTIKTRWSTISLLWVPPEVPGYGRVKFLAAVVRSASTFWKLDTVAINETLPAAPTNPAAVSVIAAQVDDDGTSAVTLRIRLGAAPAVLAVQRLMIEVNATGSFVTMGNVTVAGSSDVEFTGTVRGLPAATTLFFRVRSESSRAGHFLGLAEGAPTATFRTASSADPLPPTPQVPAPVEGVAPPLTQPGSELTLSLAAFVPAAGSAGADGFFGFEVQTYSAPTAAAARAARMRRVAASDFDSVVPVFVPADQASFSLGVPVVGRTYAVRLRTLTPRGASAYSSPMSIDVTSLCLNSCSGRGTCMSPDNVCNCDATWLGADCSLPSRLGHGGSGTAGLYCLQDSKFCMDFAFDPDLPVGNPLHNIATFRLKVRSMGYAGLLFDAPDGMSGGYGYMMTHARGSSAVAAGTSSTWSIYSPGLYMPVTDSAPDALVASSLRTWADDTHVEYVFQKTVGARPALLAASSGTQHVAWAYGQEEADDHYGNCGKLEVNFATGTIKAVGEVAYEKMYAGMIAAFLAAVIFGGLFAHNSRWRFSPAGSHLLQDRVGTWKADNGRGWHRFTLDLLPTLEDLLWGEAVLALVWAAGFIAFIVVGYAKFEDVGKDGSLTWGHIAMVHYAFVLLPVNKNSVCAWIFQSSFERLIRFHRWLGRLALVFNWVHMIQMMAVRGARIAVEPDINLWGLIATIFFSVTMLIAWEPIRRRVWRLFIAVHLLCTPVGFVFACMHTKFMWWLCIPAFCLWGIDLMIRYARPLLINPAAKVSARLIIEDMDNEDPSAPVTKYARFITELTLDVKNFPRDMEAGSYAYINIPQISLLEFHPMSISNYPPEGKDKDAPTRLTFHVLDAGSNWTHALREMVAKKQAEQKGAPVTDITVRVDGPYGRAAVELHRFRTIVLIGGGIGITPLLSILDFLCQRMACGDGKYAGVNDVHLIWSTRLAASFDWSRELLHRTQSLPAVNGRIHLHLFLFAGPDPVPRVRTWAQRHAAKLKRGSTKRIIDHANGATQAPGVEMVNVIVDDSVGVCAAVASPLAAPSASPVLPTAGGEVEVRAAHTIVGAGLHDGRDLYPSPTSADQHLVRFHYEESTDAPPAGSSDPTAVQQRSGRSTRENSVVGRDGDDEKEEWQPPMTNGLADFKAIFVQLRDAANKVDLNSLPADHVARISGVPVQSVAVLACGPPGLVADVQKQANHRGFFFHKENFAF